MPGEHKYREVTQLTPTGEVVETRLDVPTHTLPPRGHITVNQRFLHRQLD
ncbi:MAG: hypothetical protein ACRYF0_09090 [Janthinobacterium lividum]